MNDADLRDAVAAYLKACREGIDGGAGALAITGMTFLSPPQEQWKMIMEAIRQSKDDEDLSHVAAGPIEGLLGRHGPDVLSLVEHEAARNPAFARALTGVWKHTMTDEVWERIRTLQASIVARLPRLKTK